MNVQTRSPEVASPPGIYEQPGIDPTEPEASLLQIGIGDWKDTDAVWVTITLPQTFYQPVLLSRRFQQLANQWLKDTINISSIAAKVAHPAYLEIIGMGKQAVPLILDELKRRPNHWFPALRAITKESPIPEEARGRVKEMTKAWLEWGRENNYI